MKGRRGGMLLSTTLHQCAHRSDGPGSPAPFEAPSLVEGYCHMGAGFSRGVDLVFRAVTGQPLSEHLRRALRLLGSPS